MRKRNVITFVKTKLKQLGYKLAYMALLQYHAYNNPNTPRWAKNIILGSLGYLLTPIDTIVDVTPFIGYTDYIGILSFALVTISAYINDDVKIKARKQLQRWSGELDMKTIQEVEKIW
ncbi:MAG TPA: DUF1232 domain-containing protein [Membranihabitans sp.]|nr:DUF1232 domain-containing protein [Membranihabitans sp.]